MRIDPAFYRPADITLTVGNAAKAARELGWRPAVDFEKLIAHDDRGRPGAASQAGGKRIAVSANCKPEDPQGLIRQVLAMGEEFPGPAGDVLLSWLLDLKDRADPAKAAAT